MRETPSGEQSPKSAMDDPNQDESDPKQITSHDELSIPVARNKRVRNIVGNGESRAHKVQDPANEDEGRQSKRRGTKARRHN